MAKINLNRITPVKKVEDVMIDINGTEVTIKQYIPVLEKVELVQWVLGLTFDESGFASPLRKDLFTDIAIIKYYTNISLTETAMSNLNKTYDLLLMNNVLVTVKQNIPEAELNMVYALIQASIQQLIDYNTSVLGILNTIKNDYSNTTLDAEKISAMLQDEKGVALVKDVLEKIG